MVKKGKRMITESILLLWFAIFSRVKRKTHEMIFILYFMKNHTFSPPAGHYDNLA